MMNSTARKSQVWIFPSKSGCSRGSQPVFSVDVDSARTKGKSVATPPLKRGARANEFAATRFDCRPFERAKKDAIASKLG